MYGYDYRNELSFDPLDENPFSGNDINNNKKDFRPIDKIRLGNSNDIISKLEDIESGEIDNEKEGFKSKKKPNYNNYPSIGYINEVLKSNFNDMKKSKIEFYERLIYFVLIVVLFITTLTQKMRIEKLQDIMMLSHVQHTPLSTSGL